MRGNPAETLQHPQFAVPSVKKKKKKDLERCLCELGAAAVAGTLSRDQARVVVAALESIGVSPAKIARVDRIEAAQERRTSLTALSSRLAHAGERVDVLLRDAGCTDEFMEQARRIVKKTLHAYCVMIERRLAEAKLLEPLDGPQ